MSSGGAGKLRGLRILVVEDEYLIAEDVSEMLEDAGATVLGPIGWLDEALAFVRQNGSTIDGAILDGNLHGQSSYPIADMLLELDVRFVFATGYDASALDQRYRNHPRCEKPLQASAVVAALAQATR